MGLNANYSGKHSPTFRFQILSDFVAQTGYLLLRACSLAEAGVALQLISAIARHRPTENSPKKNSSKARSKVLDRKGIRVNYMLSVI